MNEDYIKQLEESNRLLQEKLEASEDNHCTLLNKPLYIYCGENGVFDQVSFINKNGMIQGQRRTVTKLILLIDKNSPCNTPSEKTYLESWESDGRGGYKWVVIPVSRRLKTGWTVHSAQSFTAMDDNIIGNDILTGVGKMATNVSIEKKPKKSKKNVK